MVFLSTFRDSACFHQLVENCYENLLIEIALVFLSLVILNFCKYSNETVSKLHVNRMFDIYLIRLDLWHSLTLPYTNSLDMKVFIGH